MSGFDRVRVRIAPSPTGDPHVGTAYVALFNLAFAKKFNGDFILRIEDTDQQRSRSSSEKMILESLEWLGLVPDESPTHGGQYGPYRQSERKETYQKHVEMLIESGKAYPCFCTAERLANLRANQRQNGERTGYDRHCRNLPTEDWKQRIDKGEPYVVRMKMPIDGSTKFIDLLRNEVEINNSQLDDQVILKTDGFPTYHLANVVDDHLMKISHVIRAEEWISSTPKHVILYEAFGWDQPTWVHLPLLRNKDKSKISKRKNPVSLNDYRKMGVLPQALVNFLSLMGWSFGDDIEKFSFSEMIQKFQFQDMHLGGPVFDLEKLTWLNKLYVQDLSEEQFVNYIREEIFSTTFLKSIYPLMRERIERFDQFVPKADFFFTTTLDYGQTKIIPKGKTVKETKAMVETLMDNFECIDQWNLNEVENALTATKESLGWKPRDFFMTLRLICTGRKDSPPLGESLQVLGKEIIRIRLREFLSLNLADQ